MKRLTGHPHKVVVCGSREFEDYRILEKTLDKLLEGIEVESIISGGCRGTDTLVKRYCLERRIIFTEVKPQYTLFGKGAPLKRNKQMAELGTSTIGFWDGKSTGTLDMLRKAKDAKHEYICYYHTKKGFCEQL